VKCIFQPAEEILPGGASLMIEEGVLEDPKPEVIVGQHVYPDLPAGKVGMKEGMYMASADELYMKVRGKGGHAALPHTVIDPVLITAHILVALQQIVSRNAKPDIPSVLSFGKIIADGATNIIPDEVNLSGTFRTFDEPWRDEAHEKMIRMAESIAESMGGACDFEVRKGYPFLVNDKQVTAHAKNAAIEYVGEDNVVDLGLRMTAEDFAYYSQHIPGCFYRLGTAKPGTKASGLHTSTFNVDEDSLEIGMGLMSWITLKQLGG
jgi:amidohydrolase